MKTKKNKTSKIDEKQELLKAQLVRALADYDNLQKRVEKEKGQYRDLALVRIIVKLLPAIDMLEDSQNHLKDSGLAIALKEMYDMLSEEGVEKVSAIKGTLFNEEVHEAVEVVGKTKKGVPTIEEVVLPGWKLGEILVRPAKVKVKK